MDEIRTHAVIDIKHLVLVCSWHPRRVRLSMSLLYKRLHCSRYIIAGE